MKKSIRKIVKELLVPSSSVYMFAIGKELEKLLKDTKYYNIKYDIEYDEFYSKFVSRNILNIIIKGNISGLRNHLRTYINTFTLYDIAGDAVEWIMFYEDKIIIHAVE